MVERRALWQAALRQTLLSQTDIHDAHNETSQISESPLLIARSRPTDLDYDSDYLDDPPLNSRYQRRL